MFGPEWHNEKIDRHLLSAKAIPFGVSYLDDALIGLLPNELLLMGARSGAGKTAFATHLAMHAANKSRRVVFFALEADEWEIQRRMKYRKMSQLWAENYGSSAKAAKFPRFREWLQMGYDADWDAIEKFADQELKIQTITLEIAYKGAHYTPDQFVAELESLQDVDLIIIDHLHYFDLASSAGQNETEGLKKAIHAIRNAALHFGKPIVLLAHLRKNTGHSKSVLPGMDEFHGHSDIAKVSTTILLTAPAREFENEGLGEYPTYFHIAKCRTAGEVVPYAGVLGFDFKKNGYSEKYHLCEASHFENPKKIEDMNKIPTWAKNCIRPTGNSTFIGGNRYGGRDE